MWGDFLQRQGRGPRSSSARAVFGLVAAGAGTPFAVSRRPERASRTALLVVALATGTGACVLDGPGGAQEAEQ